MFCLSVKMMYILVLCPVLLAAGVQTLTIDSQLGTSIEDCFERISIAEQLPPNAIYRNVSELTTRECEQICKQDKQCQSYDYGVGAKGNATCNLGNASEKEIKEKNLLTRHPDYDVYVRRFQCEQSPPSPMQPQFDEPTDISSERPSHRPVNRPDSEKPAYNDDYLISSDLASYGVDRPVYKPQFDNRPDDYNNQKPEYDSGPSYGSHKPQDLPYKPQNPIKTPSYNSKPDPYDIFRLQDPTQSYRPQEKPEYLVNDYNRPYNRPYTSEKPEYQYFTRPKPKPQQDTGYGFPVRPNDDQGYLPNPVRPQQEPGYLPNPGRPQHEPGQYASGYGQNVPNDDSYIHVQIRDPPRPYDRPKPHADQGIYGYGTYSTQNSYSQTQSSLSQYYGPGGARPDYGNNQYQPPLIPNRPAFDNPIIPNNNPNFTPKPNYGNEKPHGNPVSYGSNHASYSQSEYSSNQASYGNNPYYGGGSQRPSNDYNKPSPQQGGYGNRPLNDRPSYGNDEPSYGNDDHGYGNKKPLNENHQPSYGNNKPAHDDQPSYGDNKPVYDGRPSYGDNKPAYDDRPSYGGNKPAYDDQPSYGNNRPAYDSNHQSGYGGAPSYGNNKPYENDRPYRPNDQPSYGSGSYNQDSYGSNLGSYGGGQYYGTSQATYGHSSHTTSSHHSYGLSQGGYGSQNYLPPMDYNRPLNDRPSYGNRPSQDQEIFDAKPHKPKPTYDNDDSNHGYDNNRPNYDDNRPDTINHDEPNHSDSDPGYGNEKPNKTGVKPVYEYEMEKPNAPSYIARPGGEVVTSRPVAIGDFSDTGYGRHRKPASSYEGSQMKVEP